MVAVLLNPALHGGIRTVNRVHKAAETAGVDSRRVVLANLCATPTPSMVELSAVGEEDSGWFTAGLELRKEVGQASDVLLAWGTTIPAGLARVPFRSQITHIRGLLAECSPTNIWLVNGRTTHPSRWQRETARVHPGISFDEALPRLLQSYSFDELPSTIFGSSDASAKSSLCKQGSGLTGLMASRSLAAPY